MSRALPSRVSLVGLAGFLVVVAAEKTPRKILEEALNLLDPAKILGLVFNEDNRPMAGYHYRSHPDLTALRRLRQLMFSWRGRSERPTAGKV